MRKTVLCALGGVLLAASALADTVPVAPSSIAMVAVSPAAWQPEDGDVIEFDVRRQGKAFGSHTVTFSTAPDGALKARTEVLLKAGLGPITVYKYELEATETWKNGELVALTGAVNNDGEKGVVDASLTTDAISVSGTEFTGAVDLGILPSSHWNVRQSAASQLLSTEDGEILDVTLIEKGRETLTIAGQTIETTRYLMDSDIDVDLWYDDQGRWVKLTFEVRDQSIEYRLKSLY